MANVSPDLQWQVIRKTSSFIRRQRGIRKHFSTEKFNLKGVNSIRFNGLIHKKAIDIRPTTDNKAIVISTKIRTKTSLPVKSVVAVALKKDSRKSLKSVKNITKHYRRSQLMLAQRRASQLLRSLKPVASRRGRHVRKAEA